MNTWSPKLHVVIWTVMSLLGVFSHEVTVSNSDLKPCKEDEKVCVTDLRDCGPGPPSTVKKTLNMSCYQTLYTSMTCELSLDSNSHTESDVSLIFSSRNNIYSCESIFNPAAILNITARIKNYMMEIRSQPHTVFLYDAVKPSQPVLTALGSTEDSVDVSWRSSSDGSCRLRYRHDDAHTWSQAPDFVPVYEDQRLVYTIRDLLPFTVYRAAVACRTESGIWSNWSPDVSVRTLDRVPSEPPEVCYRLEKTAGSVRLHLTWKDLDPGEAGGRILGYQVSYEPVNRQRLQDRLVQNVTGLTAPLEVEEGNCSVTVAAFNTAGYGPAANLSIDTHRQTSLPSVRNLWVTSLIPEVRGLKVQWEMSTDLPSAPPVSHFNVQWRSETRPSTNRWCTVNGLSTSTVIQDVDPDESYLISVFPVHQQQCGSSQSLAASLQQGALKEAVNLDFVVTKTLVTVKWKWQTKSGPIRVNRYSVKLKENAEEQTRSLWPDQSQHTFPNLKPGTEYSLSLLADNTSTHTVHVRTPFDEVRVVAAAAPLLLLAVAVLIISILSRTVYKSYFFPPISSPLASMTGRWLMDPNRQKSAEKNILDLKNFQVTDVLGEKGVIVVRPRSLLSSDDDLREDAALLPLTHLIMTLTGHITDTEYVSETPPTTEQQLQSCRHDCVVNRRHLDRDFTAADTRDAGAAPPHLVHEANKWFPRKEEDNRKLDLCLTSHQTESVIKHLQELLANADSGYQITCEGDYVVNSDFLGRTDVETEPVCSYLICETDYIANTGFTTNSADENRANNVSVAW